MVCNSLRRIRSIVVMKIMVWHSSRFKINFAVPDARDFGVTGRRSFMLVSTWTSLDTRFGRYSG